MLWLFFFMLAFASGIVLGVLGVLALAIRKEDSTARRSRVAARRLCGAHMAPPDSIRISWPPTPGPHKDCRERMPAVYRAGRGAVVVRAAPRSGAASAATELRERDASGRPATE